jgi:DNA-binding CsgD family transcriptional regulator
VVQPLRTGVARPVDGLLGRDDETRRVRDLLDAASAGRAGALVLVGEPGMGKSALCRHAVEVASTFTVVGGGATEAESAVPLAFVSTLLRPLAGSVPVLSGSLAELIEPVASEAPRTMGPSSLGADLLALLAAAAVPAPLLVVIDDAHWLDRPSANALAFAVRRLAHDRVAVLATVGTDEGMAPDLPGDRVLLDGLDPCAVATLATRVAGGPVDARIVDRLVRESVGNPLATLELARALSPEVMTGRIAPPAVTPVGRSLLPSLDRRVAGCTPTTRRALLVLALAGPAPASVVLDACHRLGVGRSVFDPAVDAGIVTTAGPRLAFSHPLLGAATVRQGSAGDVRATHAALTDAWAGVGDVEHRSWHLAEASDEVDEEAAASLEEAALGVAGRLGVGAAASALERAAQLTPPGERRAARLADAAGALLLAGRTSEVPRLLDDALQQTVDRRTIAAVRRLSGQLLVIAGSTTAGADLLASTAAEVAAEDPALASLLLVEAAVPCLTDARPLDALAHLRSAAAVLARADGSLTPLADGVLATALLMAGRADEAASVLERCRSLAAPDRADTRSFVPSVASALVWNEEHDLALRHADRAITAARHGRRPSDLPHHLGCRAEVLFWTGSWEAARASATEGLALAEQSRQAGLVAFLSAVLARVEAAQGRTEDCLRHAETVLDHRRRRAAGESLDLFSGAALALLHVGLAQDDEAVAAAEHLPDWCARRSVVDTSLSPFWPDLLEALARSGRRDEASTGLDRFEAEAQRTRRTWSRAAALRCRAVVHPSAADDNLFAGAVALHDLSPTPFERARTELCWGESLHRRRHGEAERHLRIAKSLFERLGARPWSARTTARLIDVGAIMAPTRPSTLDQLTGHEVQVALTIADGRSNKEAARLLFVSPKTIEFHLVHIYRKLEVHSRSELTRLVSLGQPPGARADDHGVTAVPARHPPAAGPRRTDHH